MEKVLAKFEKGIVYVLIILMMLVIVASILGLVWIFIKDALVEPITLLETKRILDVVGAFLLVLIGMELLYMIKAYLKENVVHVEIVLEMALIAIARKVIVLNSEKIDAFGMLAIAAVIIALGVAYYLERRARNAKNCW